MDDTCRKDKGEEEDWKRQLQRRKGEEEEWEIPVEKTKVKEENGIFLQKRQR